MKIDNSKFKETFYKILDEAEDCPEALPNSSLIKAINLLKNECNKNESISTYSEEEDYILTSSSGNLSIVGDPLSLKIIAQSLRDYMDRNSIDNKNLNDLAFSAETQYQQFFDLDQDDWGYQKGHEEILKIK